MPTSIFDFELGKNSLQYVGAGLQRPECILAEADGSLWIADARGGVIHRKPDGQQQIVTQRSSEHFAGVDSEASRYLEGTLPNGLAFAANGDILIANFGTDRLEVMTRQGLLRDLAAPLAIDDFFPWKEEEAYLNALLVPQRMDEEGHSLTLEHLRQRGGMWQKSRLSPVAYPDHRFHTPSGKVEFWSERARNAGLSPLPTCTLPQDDDRARYPLHFRQGRTISAFHAFYDEGRALPSLARANVEPELWIHPDDAQQRGIVAEPHPGLQRARADARQGQSDR